MGARDLFAPIIVATMLNVVSFGLIWRGYQYERAKIKTPIILEFVFFGYLFFVAGAGYLFLWEKIDGRAAVFAGTIAGEAFAIVILYALAEGFWLSKGRPLSYRLFAMGAGTMLTAGAVAAMFY